MCNIQSRKQVEFDLQRVLHTESRFLNNKDLQPEFYPENWKQTLR